MATYSQSTYTLVFEDDYQTLAVKNGSTTTATYDLSADEVKIEVSGGNYEITVSDCSGCHTESFDLDSITYSPPLQIAGDDCIGTSDIREIGRLDIFTYHMDKCAITLYYQSSSNFEIKAPCSGGCSAPNSICRTVTYDEA